MDGRVETSWGRAELLYVIRRIRRRWRTKLVLRGLATVALVAVVALAVAAAVAAATVDPWPFAMQVTLGLRIGLAVAVLGAVVWFLIVPLRRRVSDERVALYLEEHEPSLDAAVVSAIEAIAAGAPTRPDRASAALAHRTVEAALERCRAIDNGLRIERSGLRRHFAALGAVALGAWALGVFGPASLRHGAALLLSPAPGAAAVTPISVEVLPGDTTVARGADQVITARLEGFTALGADLVLRSASDSTVERLAMAATDEAGSYGLLLFDLEEDTDYFVEADGLRSATYRLTIAELPYAGRIDLEYRFPAYTGLPPRTVEDGGDIAAIEGTVVHLRVHSTLPVPGGRVVLDDGRAGPLTSASTDSVLTGTLRVERPGFYHIELQGADGRPIVASPEFIVDALDDAPPTVGFAEPGRDLIATPIEEVYIEAEAADDFGVAGLELVYSVNGGPEQIVDLYPSDNALPEVSAGHTFYLEELELQPGDFVAYHARATDNDAVGGAKRVESDLYFLEIRPFEREYRQSEQAGAPGGGGRGGAGSGFSERQRSIIAATFNLARDSADYTASELEENLVTVRLAQERLEEEIRALARQMVMRGVTADSGFRAIAEMLPRAADQMQAAVGRLRDQQPTDALPPEQRALVQLQRAEAVFREVMVGFGGAGGSAAAGGPSNPEELADLFELERDQLENPYETPQRGARDSASQEIDEAMARLEELARRQQQESEWQRRRATAQSQGQPAPAGGGSAQGQRELAEQVEQEARRLERLSRESGRPQLMETANRLRQAADAMRRAAANGASGAADANAARERLEEARRLLDRSRGAATERRAQEALDRLARIAGEQEQLSDAMRELAGTPQSQDRAQRARGLRERIDSQAAEVAGLQRDLHGLAAEARAEQAEAARGLDEAAASMRDNQLERKVAFMERLTPPGVPPQYLDELEAEIEGDLEELRGRLGRAVDAFEPAAGDPTAETLARAGDLARGISSLGERLRASANGGAPLPSRQFRREAAERLEDAGELREQLRRAGRDVDEVEQIMGGLRRLADGGIYNDREELAQLRAALTDHVLRFEYGLRQELAAEERSQLFLSGSGGVPAGFRDMVEEYYRALAEGRRGQNEEGSGSR